MNGRWMETEPLTIFRAERKLSSWDDTRALAGLLAEVLASGGVLLLEGPLGVGKTALTKAFCAELGVTDDVTSPTFDLLHRYDAPQVAIYHVDGYRIEDPREWEVLDLPAPGEPHIIVVGEWSRALAPLYPQRVEVRMAFTPDGERMVQVEGAGEALSRRIYEGWERMGWALKS